MRLALFVHPEARAEFLDAIRYYESKMPGRGDEYDAAVAQAVNDIQWNPAAWPAFPGWDRDLIVRSRKVESFPYRVVYFARGQELVIIAFAHRHRRPGYWQQRLSSS